MLESLQRQLRSHCTAVETWGAVLAACLTVRLRPAAGLAGYLRPSANDAAPVPEALLRSQWVSVRRCHARVRRCAEAFPGAVTCLPRALALYWLLRRRRIPAELRIGVCIERDTLLAHAWVEFRGVAVGETDEVAQRYRPFPALPVSRPERVP